jgi:molybdopterin-guanine dinucleotide biosynthesis protein
MRPMIVSISGFSSNVGKTTLMCELLKCFKGWEAIKISRGHYRSCGKDPQACCISPLLGEHPQILSGERETCVPQKDTGRYWEAGASNVHWLICTNEQLEEGAHLALSKVQTQTVFIEGTSFLKFIPADFSIMVVRDSRDEIKSTALRVIDHIDAFYVSDSPPDEKMFATIQKRLAKRNIHTAEKLVYFQNEIDGLADAIKQMYAAKDGLQLVVSDFARTVR